ncbi:glycogen debranching enzyme [Bacteroides sp. CAG:709]|nr:glycogen debranching enzyme [Bacteroides sp. CAG:709]
MAFLKFNKAELVNLSYSLKREIICANKTGAYCNTSIVTCNTRRYHGLLGVPVDNFGGSKYMLLSSVDESLSVNGKMFNLGIHCYGEIYEPRGHKYIVDFMADPVPTVVYRVGEMEFVKSILLAPDKDQVMIRYELRRSPAEVELYLKPFLAFRNIHSLTKQNSEARTDYEDIQNGVSFNMYQGFPDLNLQLSNSGFTFKSSPYWYNGITYSDEARRGFDCKEDLFVPGSFILKMKEGDSIIFSASVEEENPRMITRKFNAALKGMKGIGNYHDQLLHCADLLTRDRNGHKMITAGFSWLYTGLLRETMFSLPGFTLTTGKLAEFEEILDNIIADNEERFYSRTTQVEAPLMLSTVLQEYVNAGAPAKKVWSKYGDVVKKVIESYAPGCRKEISLQPNGLLWAQKDRTALTWMNAYIDGCPVTERAGYQVETNAFWYDMLCFAIEMESKYGRKTSGFVEKWSPVRDMVAENYQKMFWMPDKGYLADYVDNNGQNTDVRPNQLFALAVHHQPVDDTVLGSMMNVVDRELVTSRGIRTLSPRDLKYRGVYEGTQRERDLAYHQGCAWPALLLPYARIKFRMDGEAFCKRAEWLMEGFYDDLNKHGVGMFSELYDGDPPHEPHGAISSAMSTAALLYVENLINKYKEER